MRFEEKDYSISALGEFNDKNLEREFIAQYLGQNIKYMRPMILFLGILYWMFIIPDFFIIKNIETIISILINRTVFMMSTIVLYFALKKVKDYTRITYWITIYEVWAVILFLAIFTNYESPDFLIQAFGVMIVILGISQVPNKWINMVAAYFMICISFIILSPGYIIDIKVSEYYAGVVYIFLVLVITSMASFKSNYYNRKQYIYSEELLLLSNTDPLTGIFNRAKFNEELENLINYSRRYKTNFSFVIFDFDNFKDINDTFGHLAGDEVIKDTVDIIRNSIRKTDIFARWGGEEFVLLLPNTDREKAIELTERLKSLITDNTFASAADITCSFGLATFEENDNADSLMSRADRFLYTAKREGKNRIVC
ncbi:MAG: diguanylate cyclase [Firmicutes bacterium]|nr:diguanylate cyclase [Bacillota bacterium]